MIDNQEIKERFVLVAAVTDDGRNLEESMHELTELTKTAGAEAVGRVVQMRESIHPGTYIGKGKIEEVRETINALDATGIICDDDLSPAQYNNLADMLDVKVMDRTMLILDIFALRAKTNEGTVRNEKERMHSHDRRPARRGSGRRLYI